MASIAITISDGLNTTPSPDTAAKAVKASRFPPFIVFLPYIQRFMKERVFISELTALNTTPSPDTAAKVFKAICPLKVSAGPRFILKNVFDYAVCSQRPQKSSFTT